MIAGHAALLARKAGRPVKIVYDRHEDMAATTKRHPARIRHRTGVKRDGTTGGAGHRHRHGRRRLHHAVAGGAVARRAARDRTVCLPQRAHPRECGRDQHPAERRLPRFRRAADAVRRGAAHGEDRRRARPRPAGAARRSNMVRRGSVLATGQTLRESVGARAGARSAWSPTRGYRRNGSSTPAWNRDSRALRTGRASAWRSSSTARASPAAARSMLASRAAVALTRDGRIRGARRLHRDRPGDDHDVRADRRRGARRAS